MPPSPVNYRQHTQRQSHQFEPLRAAKSVRRCCLGVALALLLTDAALSQVINLSALEAGVKQGDVKAMLRLAQGYEIGEGVEKNFPKSNFLYCSAAQLGDVQAQFKLGWIYANGRALTRDVEVAVGLFARAAAQGHDESAQLRNYMQTELKIRINPKVPPCEEPEAPLALQMSRELPAGANSLPAQTR